MQSIRQLTNRLNGGTSPEKDAGLTLGLPLESNGRTIYPVFAGSEPTENMAASPQQIGYLEIGEDRSDFVSLEPDYRPVTIAPLLIVFVVVVLWLFRRLSR